MGSGMSIDLLGQARPERLAHLRFGPRITAGGVGGREPADHRGITPPATTEFVRIQLAPFTGDVYQ